MRLREINLILRESLGKLTAQGSHVGSGNHVLRGFKPAIAATREILRTGTLQREATAVLAFEAVSKSAHNEVSLNQETYNAFQGALAQLRDRASALMQALTDLLPVADEGTVSIKLPEDLDLKSLSHVIAQLDKLLTQSLVNEVVDGEVTLLGFDQGTEWLDISLGSLTALSFFAGMVRIVYDLKNKELEVLAKKEMVKNLQLQNSAMAELDRALKADVESFRTARLKELFSEAGISNKHNELSERIKMSIKVLANLISRGLEVHPSLTGHAPQNLLPDPKKLFDVIKQLPAKTEPDEEDTE